MRSLLTAALLLSVPAASFAQKKEVQELIRDFALLQNDVRTMKSSMDEKFAALNVLVKEALDNATKSNTSLAVLEKTLSDRLRDQQSALNAPVAGVNTKMDQMTTEFALLKESVTEVGEMVKKLQTQLQDLDTKMTTLNTPPPPPPAAEGGSNTPPAGVTSESLYTNALQAKSGNQLDFALQQFQDYLKFFPEGSYAPNAEYHIGEILSTQGKYDEAVAYFDNVLEKYPDNSKTLDAMLSKGRALAKSGQRTAAVKEFRAIIAKSANSGQAGLAKQELKSLGMPYTPPRKR
ncbi:MAG: tetratricopeptide repeat protein [Bryobacter sp.]|nr:tetratricopeptide repeat protein [Bryobacter sp.]